jgi:ferric-dicitrate binding protein FerR (iron transport regulator)
VTRDCRNVEALLLRREAELPEDAQRALAHHLSQCDDCRAEVGMLRAVTDLLQRPPMVLSESARERAFATAFSRAHTANDTGVPVRRGARLGIALAVACAALLAVAGVWSRGEPVAQRAAPPQQFASGAPASRAPAIAAAPREPAAASAATDSGWIEARDVETRRFAHAEVTLAAGTRVRFDAASGALELRRGRADVDVDPRPHAPFAVVTQHFRVEVLGTQFTVTPERVDVRHGKVRVLDRDGAVLARRLTRGKSFVHDGASPAAGPRSARPTPAPKETSTQLLARIREALAGGGLAAARGMLDQLDALRPTRGERAEAATLRAECALLDHDVPGAIRAYLRVAETFADLPAGENAVFAAAQLAAKQRDEAQARALLERYLARYPEGRFAGDARARLAR